jgi:hypothetical protein
MRCLQCGYNLASLGRSSRCPECGRAFDAANQATYSTHRADFLCPRTRLQYAWTSFCLIAVLLPVANLSGVPFLWNSLPGVLATIGFSGPVGALLLLVALRSFELDNELAIKTLLVVAALVQWLPVWALGMRSLSPRRRPRRRTFLLILLVFALACIVSAYALFRFLDAAHGA